MRAQWAAVLLVVLVAASASAANPKDPLERARTLYNQRQFEGALAAADEARRAPERADSADLVAARAYLERFRESATTTDLTSARELLGYEPEETVPSPPAQGTS